MTNLWVRADMQTDNPETRSMIPEGLHEEYTSVMQDIGATAIILSDASEAYRLAQVEYALAAERRAEFFTKVMGVASSGEIEDTHIAGMEEVSGSEISPPTALV